MFKKNFSGHGHSRFNKSAHPFRGGGGSHFGRNNRRGGNFAKRIDPAKFIHKAVITEEMPDFTAEHSFNDFALAPALKLAITAKKYEIPTPIQDRAISYVLKGADVVGVANTGTGKTGAFLIPLIDKVLRNRKEKVLIIVPTRELAIQIDQELKGFAKGMQVFSVCCVGGAGIGKQISELRRQYNFIIGTPGRLKDLINRKMIRLFEFKTLVLDEADRMLDMGFVGEMRFVVSLMPKERQTLFFSATISGEVEGLIKEFLREPIRISVKTGNTAKNIEQDVVKIKQGSSKIDALYGLLAQKDFSKVLIFARTKHGADRLSKDLLSRGFKAESIHGNKSHSNRQRALKLFKDSHVQVLVATDVAARGLDIADISHVINFDIPATYDDYVHRIGRTGRVNKKGKALTFIE